MRVEHFERDVRPKTSQIIFLNKYLEPNRFFKIFSEEKSKLKVLFGEFDPGSGRPLAACLTHASRTEKTSTKFILGAGGVKNLRSRFFRPKTCQHSG